MQIDIGTPIQPDYKVSSRISIWANRVFVVVILIAIPLLYYFGYISVASLNRIGIILNFCAGFFLAPELVGAERLDTIESRVETLLVNLQSFTERLKRRIPGSKWGSKSAMVFFVILMVSVVFMSFSVYTQNYLAFFIVLYVILILIGARFTLNLIIESYIHWKTSVLILFLLIFLGSCVYLIIIPITVFLL